MYCIVLLSYEFTKWVNKNMLCLVGGRPQNTSLSRGEEGVQARVMDMGFHMKNRSFLFIFAWRVRREGF